MTNMVIKRVMIEMSGIFWPMRSGCGRSIIAEKEVRASKSFSIKETDKMRGAAKAGLKDAFNANRRDGIL